MSFSEWSKKKREEEKKKSTSPSSSENESGNGAKPSFSEWSKKKREEQEVRSVDSSYISSFIESANKYFSSVQDETGKVGWGNAATAYQNRQNTWNDLDQKRSIIRSWLDLNKDNYSPEDYSQFSEYLDALGNDATSVLDWFKGTKDFYSQWATEDAYTLAMEKAKEDAERLKELTGGYDPSKHLEAGKAGWADFVATQDRWAKQAADQQAAAKEKSGWEKFLGYIGDIGRDTTLPFSVDTNEVAKGYQAQETEMKYPTDEWTEEQKNIFGYLWGTKRQQAHEYAYAINNELMVKAENEQVKKVQDAATGNVFAGAGHTLGAIATAPLGLADYLGSLIAYGSVDHFPQADGELTPFEYSQAVTSGVAQHLNEAGGTINEDIPVLGGKGWGDVYGLGTSIAQSSLAAYSGGSAQALITFFGSAAASGVDEAVSRGATGDQAMLYGTAVGAAEALAEMIGIDNLMKIGSSHTAKQLMINLLKQGGAEGLEEGITAFLGNVADNLVMGNKSNFALRTEAYIMAGLSMDEAKKKAWSEMAGDIVFDMLGGFVSGGVHAGPQTAYHTFMQNNAAKSTYGASEQELVAEGLESAEGSLSRKLATKYKAKLDAGKHLSGGQLSYLVEANEQQFRSEDMANIRSAAESRLTELGETGDVSAVANALAKQAAGEKLSRAEQQIIATSKYGQRVANELNPESIRSGDYSSAWAENIGTSRINPNEYNAELMALAEEKVAHHKAPTASETAPKGNTSTGAGVPTETSYSVSEGGTTRLLEDDSEISIAGVAEVKGGKMTLKLEDGRTVDSREVAYSNADVALVYEAVAGMDVSADTAWSLVQGYKPESGVSAEVYAADINLAYKYGRLNYKAGLENLDITIEQRMTAFFRGRADAELVGAENATPTKATITDKSAGKKVIFEGFTYDEKTARPMQKASMAAIDMISKMSNLEVHVYQSFKKNGKYYAMVNGKLRPAPNGYFTEGNKIYIDINAGNHGQGAMLFTMSHEVGHYIAQWNKKDFKAISDFLFEHYGEDVPILDMLEQQKEKVINSYKTDGKALPSEAELDALAQEELVCDMLSRMFADKNAYDVLMELKQEDLNLFQKLGRAIKKLLDKLKDLIGVYDGQNPDFQYAASAENFGEEAFRQLQELYMRAFVQADANYQAAEGQKNTTDDGGVRYSFIGRAADGSGIYKTNYPPNTPKSVKQADLIRLVQDVWSQQPITLTIVEDGRYVDITAKFNPELTDRSDLAKIAFGNRKGTAAEKRMTLDLASDLYQIASEARFNYSKIATPKPNNPAHDGVTKYHYFLTNLVYKDNDGEYIRCHMNIDVKSNADGEWFYSFAIEKGSAPQTLLAAVTDNSATLPSGIVPNDGTVVKNESAEAVGVEVDEKTESATTAVVMSERTWTESDYVQEREKAAKEIAKAIGVSVKKAKAYIDSVNSIAKMIAEDRVRLDYFSSPNRSSFVGNVEYGGSFDFSTLCKKRRLLTGTFTAIQKALPNTALTANEILDIRNRMKEKGLEVSCGLCYVEGSRANMGQFAKEFLRLYKQYYPDAWQPNMADVNTPDGIEWVRINHPECYEQYEYFWNHYGTLKPGDKNLFASQQKPKLYQLHTEYKGEILAKFGDDDNVAEKNLNGGIRLQSFSDFEIVHLIDTMQIIMDMSRVGLAGQAYTKVPDFAWALGDTGLKINLSLIAKGVDENGRLIFDDVEGMPIDTAVALRNRYSKNVGTILVAFNDEQLLAAMADDRVDFIIPFHRSQWKKSQYEAMGLPAKTKDYTYMQNEKYIKPQYHEYRGRMVRDKATNYMPNEYWDFSKSGKENAEAYLAMCARNNKRPKFYKLLQNNGDGSYSLKADGSTDGYWKLLIDFKMYDNDGIGSPQMPVKPEFNMGEATRMLEEYSGGHSNFPVAQGIVDSFVQEYKDSHKGAKFSDRDAEYMAAVNRGDMEAAQRMVDAAARAAGFPAKLFHGTRQFGFTKVKTEGVEDGVKWSPFFATNSIQTAQTYSRWDKVRQVSDAQETDYDAVIEAEEANWDEAIGDFAEAVSRFVGVRGWMDRSFVEDKIGYLFNDVVYRGLARTDANSEIWDWIAGDLEGDIFEAVRPYEFDDMSEEEREEATEKLYEEIQEYTEEYLLKFTSVINSVANAETDSRGNYQLYANTDNLFVIDAKGNNWNSIDFEAEGYFGYDGKPRKKWKTRDLAEYARDKGYSGVRVKNVIDDGGQGVDKQYAPSDVYIFFNPQEQVKSADTVTYDDSGKVIPLSERFNAEESDIRYADRDYVAYDHTAILREQTVDRWLSAYASKSSPKYAQAYIAYIGPRYFLDLTTSYAVRDHIESESTPLDAKKFAEATSDQPLFLDIDHDTGKVTGHEGRHRCVALERADILEVPVLLFDTSNKYSKTDVAEMTLRGQFDRLAISFVYDAIPLSYENRDRIISKFATMSSMQEIGEKYGWKQTLRYQDRPADSGSNRSLLADAFEEMVRSPQERQMIDEYRANISKVDDVQERLNKVRTKIHELTVSKGDKTKIAALQKTATELAALIDSYDRKLLEMEASKPLRDVLARARQEAYRKAKQKGEERIAEYRQQTKERFSRGVESRKKTAMRAKIRKTIRDLDKILNRGDKKRNVKEGMKGFVEEALASAEILFTENYGNEDMIRNGVEVEMTPEEEKYMTEARAILAELYNLPSGSYEAWAERQGVEESLKSKLAYRMGKLKDVFYRERLRLNKTKVADVLSKLADAYAKLETSEYAYVSGAYNEAIHQYLKTLQEEVGGATIRDMSLNQLELMHTAYTMVLHSVRKANEMFTEGWTKRRDELANGIMFEVKEAGGVHGRWSAAEVARNRASWNNTKPIYAAERIGSDTFKQLWAGLFRGQYNWAVDMEEAKAFRQKLAEKYGVKNWDMEELYTFTSASGLEFQLNLNQIMSIYAYSKREQAHDHLTKGGFVFGKDTEVIVNKHGIKVTYYDRSATAYKLSDELVEDIVSMLDTVPGAKQFVDEMQDYLSTTVGEKGNEVSMKLYGVKLFNEAFYFPLRSAGQYMERAKEADLKKQQGQVSIVNSSFTHATKPKANNPVVLEGFMDVWASHVNEMSMYHSMVLPMEDFRRVYNYSSPNMEGQDSVSVNSVIENAYGPEATGYIDQLYKELNGGAVTDPRETPFKEGIGKFKKAAVMLSSSVVVQQFSAIGRAYALIDPKYFIGAKVDKHRQAAAWEEMKRYAPVAIIKEMGGFDTHTGGSAKDYLLAEEYGKGERIKGLLKDEQYRSEIMGMAPAKADELTWCAIWEAVKRETKAKHPKMDVKSEEFLKAAGERFSEVIEKTQVYDSVLARSANMRSKGGLMQMATAFLAEPTTTVNMIEDALRKKDKKYIARTFASVFASIVINNALASIVYAMRDDDDDETFLEKYAQALVSGMLDDLNPMTYYPFLKDVWSLLQGYDVERSDISVISDLVDAVERVAITFAKIDKDMDEEELSECYKEIGTGLMGLLDAGFNILGIPAKNVRREITAIVNTFKTFSNTFGSTTWNSFVDAIGSSALDSIPIVGLFGGESRTDKLYDAIVSGDTTYLARLKAGYKSEDSYNAAVRKALRENDPRIHQAALAGYNGDPSERVRIARLIIADGFSQDNVVAAINAEINNMKPDEPKSDPKAKGFYTAEDFAREIANGDQAAANAAKVDVIQTAQKNGKSAEEATKSFVSSAKAELKDLFLIGRISEQKAINALTTYCDMKEDDAIADVQYWAFKKDYPDVFVDDQWFDTYYEKIADSGIEIDVYMEYRNAVAGITGENKKSGRMSVINSLPITSAQKDALYLAEGWAASKLNEAPWH